jgi:CheY-like chemotaxis protein
VVLDSFRKILVYANYAIDTVETGREALGLVQKNDYDFVFTDLKMPEMDGLDVLKAVKHLRPDIDVIMITGYATIESAVEAMKHGGMDYVQKPFTEDELVDFVNKCLIRRQDRIEREKPPTVRLVTPSVEHLEDRHVYNIPAGVFVSPGHAWVSIETNGLARIGIDDFLSKIIGAIDDIEMPKVGRKIARGETLLSIVQSPNVLRVLSPISGTVRRVNHEILERLELLKMKPYELGWLCCLEPARLSEDLKPLRIGADALAWYEEEVRRYREIAQGSEERRDKSGGPGAQGAGARERVDPATWTAIAEAFMRAGNGSLEGGRPQ